MELLAYRQQKNEETSKKSVLMEKKQVTAHVLESIDSLARIAHVRDGASPGWRAGAPKRLCPACSSES